ncbi:alpha-2-macroglobulin family protein [Polymorphum gilvum]|nr:alpha-2-macroglobulin family protein [Polymorphum gilvum]
MVFARALGSSAVRLRGALAVLALFFALAGALAGATGAASAAERRVVTIPDADYFGADYRTVKEVELATCEAACLADPMCRAFTYNTAARWCFLKSDAGQLQSFRGAVAGRVVEVVDRPQVSVAERRAELAFVPKPYMEEAQRYALRLPSTVTVGAATAETLRQSAMQALSARAGEAAALEFARLLVLLPGDADAWVGLSLAQAMQNPDDWSRRMDLRRDATSSAINAYLRSAGDGERVRSLGALASALSARQDWKPAIRALRAALALDDSPSLRQRYDDMVAQHGFRIVDHQVDADAAEPRICVVFSDDLARGEDLAPFVRVSGEGGTAVETDGAQICITGVRHGARYGVTVREGVPSADSEKLERSADLTIYVRDRAPSVHFLGRAYVLPRGKDATIPIVSVNTTEVQAEIYRVGDRGLADVVRDDRFLGQLRPYQADTLGDELGEKVWTGVVETESRLNVDVTTAIPLDDIGLDLKPGVYAMTARSKLDTQDDWGPRATQWFIVSDLGLSAYSGSDGVTASVRSLASAEARAGVPLRLVAVNNEILGEAVSDANGMARFAPGLSRGRGGRTPSLLVAETADGDYSFLDLRKPAFDLSDRGVDGRPASGPLDVFAWTERGIYKGGETVHAQALLRNADAVAQEGLPLTVVFDRPDGVEYLRTVVSDAGLGGYAYDLPLPHDVQQGVWSWRVLVDPKGEPLAQKTFLVEDYQPERVDYALETDVDAFDPAAPARISLSARFLYGAPASGQVLEGEVTVSPVRALDAYPGYVFGLADEEGYPIRDTLPEGLRTDGDGALAFDLSLPELSETTGLYKARLVARLVESGGRYVERRLERPVVADGPRIGIKPAFSGGVDEGGPAGFDIVLVDGEGRRIEGDGLVWTLSRVERRYQWYRTDGSWSFEPVTTSQRVANGRLEVAADRPAHLSVPVEWGRYRLEIVREGDRPAATSTEFSAGWYVAEASSETPDFLDVGLDKAAYRPGETAVLRLKPQFDGFAVVNVLSNRLIATHTVKVEGAEARLDLPVTDDWGAGAYVTATLYRPMDIEARRMPARAIGVNWLQVEPGDRRIAVEIGGVERMLPRSTLEVPVRLAKLAAGEAAYLTLAAVDVGILNLTGYKTPDPDGWYFGQRRLGMDLRDLYGQLIDRTAGTRGQVRSGGDGGGMLLQAPPPDEEPVALFSGIVQVDADGRATVSFDVPDFNGTLRLMAVAWTASGVGHGEKDVEVRDPVVLTASLPRFLGPGDRSRMLIEIDNVDGPAGAYTLTTAIDGPVAVEAGMERRVVELTAGQRTEVLMRIAAAAHAGDAAIRLDLDGPDGTHAEKSLALGVRDTQPLVTRRSLMTLASGNRLTLDADSLAGLRPGTTSVSIAAGGAARIDVPGLLAALDRYPYGCTEQTTSRALPLLYLNEVAESVGLGTDAGLRERIVKAIAGVLANQSSSGSFGVWNSYGDSDTWLDAYVADFLVRAREKGYEVQQIAFESALDNLENRLAYASDFSDGGEGIAYALYVLARTGRASIGDLRYYLDVKLADFATPLAKAQVAAGLALYGEQERAKTGFRAAVDALPLVRAGLYREDYGSPTRDGAGVLSYIAETRTSGVGEAQATAFVAVQQERTVHLSTQDMAWLLLAAREADEQARNARLTVDGNAPDGRIVWRFEGSEILARPVVFANEGAQAVDILVSVAGQPEVPEPAGGDGFTVTRTLYDLDGTELDPSAIPYNTRVAVVLTVEPLYESEGRLLVVDRLPGGLAIDNPRLVRSGDLGALDWLQTIDQPDHVEFRQDRFVVSVDQKRFGDPVLTFAYLARAVTPGSYVHPPATVEDMYQPDRQARTDTGRFEVLGPVR